MKVDRIAVSLCVVIGARGSCAYWVIRLSYNEYSSCHLA